MSHRSWVFTVNTYRHTDVEQVFALREHANTVYAAYEIGEEEGRPHIQGYVTFKQPHRVAGFNNLLPRGHYKKAIGTPQANKHYIIEGFNSDGTKKSFSIPFLNYEKGQQGARKDLDDAIATLVEHGLKRCAQDHSREFVKYHKGLAAHIDILAEARSEYPTTYWLWGPTGIGKTRFAWLFSKGDLYNATMAPHWFDGLHDHRYVVLDEFDKHVPVPDKFLLNIMDRYPYRVPIKGSSKEFNVPHIFITSTVHPNSLFTGDRWDQIARRITWLGTRPTPNDDMIWEFYALDQEDPNEVAERNRIEMGE